MNALIRGPRICPQLQEHQLPQGGRQAACRKARRQAACGQTSSTRPDKLPCLSLVPAMSTRPPNFGMQPCKHLAAPRRPGAMHIEGGGRRLATRAKQAQLGSLEVLLATCDARIIPPQSLQGIDERLYIASRRPEGERRAGCPSLPTRSTSPAGPPGTSSLGDGREGGLTRN